MANIKKIVNKNGTSYKITVFSGRDSNGKQIRHYMTWTPEKPMTERQMEKEVQKVAFQFEEKLKQGYIADNRQTFQGYAAYVLDLKRQARCKGKTVEAATAEGVAKAVSRNVKDLFTIESGKRTLSPKTILEHHRLIHTVLAQAEKEMLVPYNAADKATPPKAPKSDPNYFQTATVAAIWEALEQEPLKWQVITHLLAVTGCRRGEIMGLRWDRVDFKNSQIKIDTNLLYSSKRPEGEKIYIDTTKTEGSYRFIKLPAETMQLLRDYHREYLTTRLSLGGQYNAQGFLFTKADGNPMIPDSITAWLSKFSERHNLPHMNPHAFRHTMASILIQNGQDIVSVSKRLGHAQTSTTTDLYSHIIQEADERASECIAGAILRKNANAG